MRRGVWLIWLCLALVPLRGMAHATMQVAAAPHGAPVLQADAAAAMPCPMHASPVGDVQAAVQPGAAGESPTTHSCQLCDLCHSAALPMALRSSAESPLPDAAPVAVALLGAGRQALDGLFRPPR